MTKEDRRKTFLVILVIAVLAAGVAVNEEARQMSARERLSRGDYYDQLLSRCEDGCCEASVSRMRQTKAKIQETGGCGPSEKADMLKCATTYRWCEPAK
jgi:hypothetical protein